jgi:hypothetical protein
MGMAEEERRVSNIARTVAVQNERGGHAGHAAPAGAGSKPRVPGFPQDMSMPMDDEVAKPETFGLAKNWTGATQGMMTLVRVLPADRYEEIMRRVAEARSAPPKPKPAAPPARGHQH